MTKVRHDTFITCKRAIVLLCLACSAPAAAQHYEPIGDPDGSSIDVDSIQYDGVVRHFALMLPNKDGGHSIAHETINCQDRSFRIDDSSVYDRAGNLVNHWNYHETMSEIEEGTTAEDYLYRVCR